MSAVSYPTKHAWVHEKDGHLLLRSLNSSQLIMLEAKTTSDRCRNFCNPMRALFNQDPNGGHQCKKS